MVQLVAFFQTAQNGDRVLHIRLFHQDGLETPLQRGIFFDVLPVFVQRGGADAMQFAPRQHGLEKIARIHAAFGRTRTNDRMQFVNEKNDVTLCGRHLFQHRFQPFFKLAAVLGSGNECPHIQRNDPFVFQRFRHVAADDPAGEPFHDRRLAHPRFPDEDRVVFRAAGKDLDGAADLIIPPDHRVDFVLGSPCGQVAPVLFQSLEGGFRRFAGDPLVAPDRLQRGQERVRINAEPGKDFFADGGFFHQTPEQMFHADELIFHLGGFVPGGKQRFAELPGGIGLAGGGPADFRQFVQFGVHCRGKICSRNAHALQQRGDQPLLLRDQGFQKVQCGDFAVSQFQSQFLCLEQGSAGFFGQFLHVHSAFSFIFRLFFVLTTRIKQKACQVWLGHKKSET